MRTRFIATAVLATLVLVSCSGGDDGSSQADTTTTTADAATVAVKQSAGCDQTAAIATGLERITTTSGGQERWYYRQVPTTGTQPYPVVLDLHGYAEGAQVHLMMSDLGNFGDQKGFITITPQGQGAVARWDTDLESDDVAFIGDFLDEVEDTLCVDRNRIFVTGLSNGAFMTSALSCAYADRIAAAAPIAGIRGIDDCDPSRPVPVIAFHGTADTFVAYDGGVGESVADLPAPDGSGRTLGEQGVSAAQPTGPTIEEITAGWAERNGCETTPTETAVAADVTLLTFPCPKGAEAELYRIEGGGHSWPGSEFSKTVVAVVGPTTTSVSANELMWEFFADHPLVGA